jgi:hypothetical protein
MGLFALRTFALASAVALAGLTPAAAAPGFVQSRTTVQSDVVQVQESGKIVRRDRLHRDDGGVWKKKRHFRDRRDARRDRDHDGWNHDGWDHDGRDLDGRDWVYRPKATQKFAYDEYGNRRIYDGDGWDRDWRDNDGRDWRKQKRKRPRLYRMQSLGTEGPSPELRGILTTVPD